MLARSVRRGMPRGDAEADAADGGLAIPIFPAGGTVTLEPACTATAAGD